MSDNREDIRKAVKSMMRVLDRLSTDSDRREALQKLGPLYDLVVSPRGGQA